jgi:hypothetical protein
VLASRGTRDLDAGVERVPDEQAKARARVQARGVALRSLLVAAVVTTLAWAVPPA